METMVKPLRVEVVAYVLGSLDHCSHCQVFIDGSGVGGRVKQADLDAYPPEFRDEWRRLSDLVLRLGARYAGRLEIKITDAQSPQGLWQAIRHGVRKYPTFIIAGQRYHGWDDTILDGMIRQHLAGQG